MTAFRSSNKTNITISSGSISTSTLAPKTLDLYKLSINGTLRSQKIILVPVNWKLTVIREVWFARKDMRFQILTSVLTNAVHSRIYNFSTSIKGILFGLLIYRFLYRKSVQQEKFQYSDKWWLLFLRKQDMNMKRGNKPNINRSIYTFSCTW